MESKWMARSSSCVGLALLLAACGGDSGGKKGGDSPGGEGADAGTTSGGNDDNQSDAKKDGGVSDDPTACMQGQQDNDGDGACAAACSESVECGAGSCNDTTGSTLCVCDVGYTGDACDACATGHEGDGCGTCSDGYVASTLREGSCIADPCAGVECGIHGTCEVSDDAALCACDVGWAGDSCNTCDTGYEGAACDQCAADYQAGPSGGCIADACVSTDCGNGTCSFDGVEASCKCDKGFAGDACDVCALGYLMKKGACVLELPVQNDELALWLDATSTADINAAVGEAVYLWRSRAGSPAPIAGQPTPDSAPTLVTAGGVTFVRFDGTDDFLKIEDLVLDQASYSLFIAARPSKSKGDQGIVGGVSNANATHHGLFVRSRSNAAQVQYLHRSPFAATGTAGSLTADGYPTAGLIQPFQIITAERRGNGAGISQILRGGSSEVTAVTTQTAFAESVDLIVGSRTASLERLQGDIGEIILYNGTITAAEREEVEAYLQAKWKVGFSVVIKP